MGVLRIGLGPSRDEGHAHAAFVMRTFLAAQRRRASDIELVPDENEKMEEAAIACFELLEATSPNESIIVGKMLNQWLMYRSFIFRQLIRGTCPHDPLTVAEAVYPDRFMKFKEGFLMVHEWGAFPTFVTQPGGPHRIGCEVEKDLFLQFLTKYLRPLSSNYKK